MAEDYRAYINMSPIYFLRCFGGVTNWELCVLCQKQSEEKLVCLLSNPIPQHGEAAYKEFISLADQFQNVDATPIPILNIQMKSPCETILHPDTRNAVSCTI